MIRNLLIFVISFWTFVSPCFSQTNTLSKADYPKILTPSPEAVALGKYGDLPVSLYSGSPQISIPFYEYQNGDIKFNIGLNYNAGGIKIDETATNVGLGWSLNAGGVITRTVLGIPDGYNEVSFPGPAFNPNMVTTNTFEHFPPTADCFLATDAVTNNRDLERDIYFYNFAGMSGKFVIDRSNIPRLIPANPNIKISPYDGTYYNSGFIITDDKGNKYIFNTYIEGITGVSYNCSIGGESPREFEANFNSAWYLSKIETPAKRNTYFEYESYSYTIDKGFSEVSYKRQQNVSGCIDLSNKDRRCMRSETYAGYRLKKIYSTNNSTEIRLKYSSSSREDLSYNGSNAGNSLDSINIFYSNQLRKSWQFGYAYFGTGTSKRLKLLTVKEDSKPAYEFTYDESHSMPDKFSLSQDHWGFYNGKSNSTLIPPVPYMGKPFGADREADLAYMKTYSLSKIKYPTGGTSVFEYEGHTDQVTEDSTYWTSGNATLTIPHTSNPDSVYFHLPADPANVLVSWYAHPGNYDDFVYARISDSATNTIYLSYLNSDSSMAEITGAIAGNHTYKFNSFRTTNADSVYIHIEWMGPTTVSVTHTKIIYGGLRIKSIKDYDSVSGLSRARYYYYNSLDTPSKSMIVLPDSTRKDYFSLYEGLNSETQTPVSDLCHYTVFSSSSVPEIGNGLDNVMGYRQVIMYDSSASIRNGRSIYKYTTDCSEVGVTIGAGNQDWVKGLLLEQIDQLYDTLSQKYKNVKRLQNIYQGVYSDSCFEYNLNCTSFLKIIPNIKLSYVRQPITLPNGRGYGVAGTYPGIFEVEKYYTISALVHLKESRETSIDTFHNTSLTKTTRYYYENDSTYIYPTKIETYDSRGHLIENKIKYVSDSISNISPNIYNALVTRNIVSPVIEEVSRNVTSNIELSKRKIAYRSFANGDSLLMPYQVITSLGGSDAEANVTFGSYDSLGNILSYTGHDQIPVSYIWDYHNEYPVAEFTNADTNSIAYTSFEADSKGKWHFTPGPVYDTTTPSGKYCFSLNTSTVSRDWLNSAIVYTITLWKKTGSGTVSFNGNAGTEIFSKNGWTLLTYDLTGSNSATISGSAYIDEIRLFPKKVLVKTFTYTPLIGINCALDANNRGTYYEYDNFNRLILIRDDDKKIIKKIEYQYHAAIQ